MEKINVNHDKNKLCFYYNEDSYKGELNYEFKNSDTIDIFRTFVDPNLRGKGIAKNLMNKVVKFAMEQNYKIIPTCNFAVSFFKVNKDYQYLLADNVNLKNQGSCRIVDNIKK